MIGLFFVGCSLGGSASQVIGYVKVDQFNELAFAKRLTMLGIHFCYLPPVFAHEFEPNSGF